MLRIGLSRWYIQTRKAPAPRGEVEYELGLIPQASRYRTLATEFHGLNTLLVEKDVDAEPVFIRRLEPSYEVARFPAKEIALVRKMADELAVEAVGRCVRLDILDPEGLDKPILISVLKTAIMRQVEHGTSEMPEYEDYIDLVADQRTLLAARDERRQEAERLRDEARRAQRQRQTELNAVQNAVRKTAVKTSLDFLYSFLSDSERAESEKHGWITIRNALGEFRVPMQAHHFVTHRVDGKYVASYCLIFQDRSIPVGDEVLMKIALLKADTKRFLASANKFILK